MSAFGPDFVMYPHAKVKLLGKDLTAEEVIEAVAAALLEANVHAGHIEFYRREATVFGKGDIREVLRISHFWVTIA